MVASDDETTSLRRFKTYRDGLMIALLASRPLRLRNLTGLALDRTLVRRGEEWRIQIPASETKTKTPVEAPWPEMLAPYLETYLADHRAGIAGLRGSSSGTSSHALWLSMYSSPMSDNAIYSRIVARTLEGLGQPINPHLFRDCAATSIAIEDPAHVGIASHLLSHRAGSTTERYYNQAGSVEASRLMQRHILALRKDPGRRQDVD
jgi:integrase